MFDVRTELKTNIKLIKRKEINVTRRLAFKTSHFNRTKKHTRIKWRHNESAHTFFTHSVSFSLRNDEILGYNNKTIVKFWNSRLYVVGQKLSLFSSVIANDTHSTVSRQFSCRECFLCRIVIFFTIYFIRDRNKASEMWHEICSLLVRWTHHLMIVSKNETVFTIKTKVIAWALGRRCHFKMSTLKNCIFLLMNVIKSGAGTCVRMLWINAARAFITFATE